MLKIDFKLLRAHLPILFLIPLLILVACSSDKDEIIDEPIPEDIYIDDPSFKVVGYVPYYRFDLVSQMDFSKVTYVNIAFGNLNENGEIVVGEDVDIKPYVDYISNRGPKIMLSLAGGAISPTQRSNWAKSLNNENRRATIENMLDFVDSNDLHGIDVDIEGSLISDVGFYNEFVKELKIALHGEGKAITAALPGFWLSAAVQKSTLSEFDWINLMVYDATGPWNPSNPGQHSSYELAIESIDFWENVQDISSERLVLGVPFYAHNFDPDNIGSLTYRTIISMDPAYAYQDQVDLSYYNGIPTIMNKTKLALKEVNGVMIWELGQDAYDDLSLMRIIGQTLDAADCLDEMKLYYRDSDEDGYGDLNHPTISCSQPQGYVDNRDDCDDTDSDMNQSC